MVEVDTSVVETIKVIEELNKSREREREREREEKRRLMHLSFVSLRQFSATSQAP